MQNSQHTNEMSYWARHFLSFVPLWLSLPPSGSISPCAALKHQSQKTESKPHRTGRRHFQGEMVCSWAALGTLGTLKCWATCLNTHLCCTCSLALELIEKVSDVAAFFCSLPVTQKVLSCIKQENVVFVKLPKVKQIICLNVSKSTAVELPPEHWLVKLTHQSAYVLREYPCYVVKLSYRCSFLVGCVSSVPWEAGLTSCRMAPWRFEANRLLSPFQPTFSPLLCKR